MFAPRTPRYPMLQAYLAARPKAPLVRFSPRRELTTLSVTFVAVAVMMGVLLGQAGPFAAFLSLVVASVCGVRAFLAKPAPPLTPEQQLAQRADAVVDQLRHYAYLHRAFHPAVGATLEECATYAACVQATLGNDDWDHRGELRQNALAAVRVAMDEALVHAGATLPFTRPTRPVEHVSDALEDIGFGPLVRSERDREPLPPSFRPVRELAERLRELAERCETAATQRPLNGEEPASAAFRHLDVTLGEMRRLEEAETELRQGA